MGNYFRTLLGVERKRTFDAPLPFPHELAPIEKREFLDLIREMDQPLSIVMQMNYITEMMLKNGVTYDFVISPFYGGAELGFALIAMMDMKGMDNVPRIIPVRFSGEKARGGKTQKEIFPRLLNHTILGKSLLIIDDNSGTGITIRKLKRHLSMYSPRNIDLSVVQVGTTTRVARVLSGEKRNYNRSIIRPEDLTYKAAQVYNLKASSKRAEEYLFHIPLANYVAN